jgi:hypothetical protein
MPEPVSIIGHGPVANFTSAQPRLHEKPHGNIKCIAEDDVVAYGDARAAEAEAQKDAAYEERNRVVALLAALLPSVRTRTAIEGWSEDWHGCVYITLPDGSQASWHFHDSQAHLFAHVPEGQATWDGHTTPEKYTRIERCTAARPNIAAAPQPNHQGILNSSQPAAQPVAFDLNAAVDRFLGWPLPQDFAPDGGITFDRKVRTAEGEKDRAEMRPAWWPVGTNLLTADQARAMLAHVLGLSAEQQPAVQPEPMARFCPGCGSVGPVPEKYRDCCPDGDKARMIPEPLARHCHDLFHLALSAPGDWPLPEGTR